MSQYNTGTVMTINGSPTVVGSGTIWVGNVSAGNLFKINEENCYYVIQSVTNDNVLILESNYGGVNEALREYTIVTDLTNNYKWPKIMNGDQDWQYFLSSGMISRVDVELWKKFKDRVFVQATGGDRTLYSYEYKSTFLYLSSYGTFTGNFIVPLTEKRIWICLNQRSASSVVKGSTGSGVTIAASRIATVYCDGINIIRITPDTIYTV